VTGGETLPIARDLGDGVTCIDASYVEPGMACFYLVESGGEYAVVETGTNHSVANLLAVLRERDIGPEQVRYVIPTHVHLDHAGGAGRMMQLFPAARLLVHPRGARHMADPEKLVAGSTAVYGEALFRELYGEVCPVAVERIDEIGDGDSVALGSRRLEFRHTEGHARHHFCVWDETSAGWFSGDMFGICYPWFRFPEGDYLLPSTTPTQFDPAAYHRSLELLGSYGPRRMYLTHYGAVQYGAEHSRRLAEQVDAYREIATRGEGDLEGAIGAYTLERLRAFTPSAERADLERWLDFDVRLNAQGVAIWREREAGS